MENLLIIGAGQFGQVTKEIAESLNKFVNEISDTLPIKENPNLCNRQTGNIYNGNYLLRQTDIRNGTELVLF